MPHLGSAAEDYLTGHGTAEGRRRQEEHLQVCPSCRLLVARERQRLHLLAAAPCPAPDNDLAARILSRTRELDTSGTDELRLPYRGRRAARRLVLTAAALAVAGTLGGTAYLVGATPSTSAATHLAGAASTVGFAPLPTRNGLAQGVASRQQGTPATASKAPTAQDPCSRILRGLARIIRLS
jgi:anti-sigma-K factor RskA